MQEGGIEQAIRMLLTERPDMPRTEMAETLGISRKTLYKHLGRIGLPTPSADPHDFENGGSARKREMHPHDGRRDNRPPPGPHSTGFKPGNAEAVTTGEFVNPFLRELFPERDAAQIQAEAPGDETEALIRSVQLYEARLRLQVRRLRKLEEQRKAMVPYESTFTRQEGDGALMGTGRVATRKRRSLDEEIRRQHQVIDRTQARYDAAVKAIHDFKKGEAPSSAPLQAYMDALNATAAEVWADEGVDGLQGDGNG